MTAAMADRPVVVSPSRDRTYARTVSISRGGQRAPDGARRADEGGRFAANGRRIGEVAFVLQRPSDGRMLRNGGLGDDAFVMLCQDAAGSVRSATGGST